MNPQELNTLFEITSTARDRLRQTDLAATPPNILLDDLLTLAETQDDYSEILEKLEQAIQSTQRWHSMLQEIFIQVQGLQAQHEARERYSEKWWARRRASLEKAFAANQEQGWQHWLVTFTTTLLDWELEMCRQLIDTHFDVPGAAQPLLDVLRRGIDALLDKRPADALDMFTQLTPEAIPGAAQSLDARWRSLLYVRAGHIYLYEKHQPVAARVQFNLAQTLAPADSRPLAALGDVHRVQDELDQAERLYQQAIDLSPDQPEGLVGMGLLAEKRGWWDEAEAWYVRAIAKVQSARTVDVALRRAVGLTEAPGNYPDRLRRRFSGMLFETFGQPEAAALAYYEAGIRYHWRQESLAAIDLLRKSIDLDDSNPAAYWQLSDALLSESYLPAPALVDPPFARESLAVWEEAAARGFLPDAGQSWSYISRALVNEQLSRLPDSLNKALLWWEGIAYFERALLINGTNSYTWSYLSRYHHNLEHEACAVQAFEKALEFAPDDEARAVALGEQATLLANIGYLEEAKAAIDAYLALKDDPWIEGTHAFVLAFTGEYQASLDILDRLIAATPANMWYREVRTFCYRRLDRIDDLLTDCRWMWDLRDHPDYAGQQSTIGWAAFSLFLFGDHDSTYLDAAIDTYHALPAEAYTSLELRNLGIFYLAKGNIPEGERCLLEGIHATAGFRELDELRDADLADLRRFSSGLPAHDRICHSLDTRILPAIEVRRAEIGVRKTPLEEMRALRDDARRIDPAEGWMLTGAQAGLARLCVDRGDLDEAAAIYRELRAGTSRFPEAVLGLQKIASTSQELGDDHLRAGHPGEARAAFERALAAYAHAGDGDTYAYARGDLYARVGLCYLDLDQDAQAEAAFREALHRYADGRVEEPGNTLGDTCRALLRDTAHYWTLDAAWSRWQRAPSIDAGAAAHWHTARDTLRRYLDNRYNLPRGSVSHTPIVTPIAVEIAARFIPDDPGPDWVLIKTILPEMRARIERETGVSVPGVRVRSGDNLGAQDYVIHLHDVPVAWGSVERTGEQVLTDIAVALENVLHQNLADFLGVQEVENLLEAWGKTAEDKARIATALPNDTARLRFARVLRALVAEQVPITRWGEILDTVAACRDGDIAPAVTAVRQRLKSQLPGNAPQMHRVALPATLEDSLQHSLPRHAGRIALALPVETMRNAYRWLGPRIDGDGHNTVLITHSSELRPVIRRLSSYEFPRVQVLTTAEVLDSPEEADDARR